MAPSSYDVCIKDDEMKFIPGRNLCIALFTLLLCSIPLKANWGGQVGGSFATGTFKAMGTNQVQMVDEKLVIRLYKDYAHVEIDYVLRNTGKDVDVRAGFPSLGVAFENEPHYEIKGYTIVVDGKPVMFERVKGDAKPYLSFYTSEFMSNAMDDDDSNAMLLEWLVSTVHFKTNENKNVHITYDSIYAYSSGGYSDDVASQANIFRYLLSTGAAWQGPIQHGTVTIIPAEVNGNRIKIMPDNRFKRVNGNFVWEFKNLKPSIADDIDVDLNDRSMTIPKVADTDHGEKYEKYYISENGNYYLEMQNFIPHATSEVDIYKAENIANRDQWQAWRPVHSPGIGETLTLDIQTPSHVDAVGIIPGCLELFRSNVTDIPKIWYDNNRLKEVEVSLNGRLVKTAVLSDWHLNSPGRFHYIELPAYEGDAKKIEIKILSVYPGKANAVTCVNQVVLRQNLKTNPKIVSDVDNKTVLK